MFTSKSRQILRLCNILNNSLRNKHVNTFNSIKFPCAIPAVIEKSILYNPNLQIIRCKHKDTKKGKKQEFSESEDEEETESFDDISDKQSKVLKVKVNSLRADLILKAGLGIARNKIETLFYESKIRVNGQKLLKKSSMLSVGDEIDIVRGNSPSNPDFLTVSRVEILSTSEREEGLNVKLRRNKALVIENYENDPERTV